MDETNRDITLDIQEITARLGEPDAVYQSNPRSTAWRLIIGITMVIAAAILHYFVWTGGIPAFQLRHVKAWILLILAMTVGPGTGLYLIYFAIRGLRMWVLEYPSGLFVWHRGEVVAMPWDELASVTFKGLPSAAPLIIIRVTSKGLPSATPADTDTAYFNLARSTRRLFGTELILTRDDGATVSLSSILKDFPTLGEHIQRRLYERHFEVFQERLRLGETLNFGMVSCTQQSVVLGEQAIAWSDIAKFDRAKDKYNILQLPKKKLWAYFDIDKVPNLHLLLALAHEAMRTEDPLPE